MNVLISLVLLVLAVLALQHNLYLFFGASIVAAILASPRMWIYIVGTGVGMFLLKYFGMPSWDVLSFLLIGVAYGVMSGVEERKEKESIPPELLYYMMGGGRVAP